MEQLRIGADPLEFDSAKAEAAADQGMDDARRAERVQAWKLDAERWLLHYPQWAQFTADDLVREIGLPDTGPGRNNVVGAWLSAKSKARSIRFAGTYRKSERTVRHGNLQRVWVKV